MMMMMMSMMVVVSCVIVVMVTLMTATAAKILSLNAYGLCGPNYKQQQRDYVIKKIMKRIYNSLVAVAIHGR